MNPSINEPRMPLSQAAVAAQTATPQPSILQAGGDRSTFDFRYITAAIRSNLLLIVLMIAAFVGIAVVVTMLDTPRFTATATVQINDTTSRVLGQQQEDQQQAMMGGLDTDRFLKTQIEVLQSRGLAQKIVQKLKLADDQRFFASQELELPKAASPEQRERMATALVQGNLKSDLPRDSRIATISWTSTDAATSARIANAYANEFIQSDLQRKFDSSAYARNFVSDQLAATRARVEQSERALNTYSRDAGLISTRDALTSASDKNGGGGGGGSVTTGSLVQINTAANDATAKRIVAEGEWRAINSGPLLASSAVANNGTVSLLLSEKARLEAELQQERSAHLDAYPTVRAKAQQLGAIDKQITQVANNVREGLRAQYAAAAQTEAKLKAEVAQLKDATLGEQDRTVQYALLAREADTNRQVYDGLLQRFKQLNASAGISLSNISIVDNAEVPGAPSSPNLVKNVLAGLIIGIGLAAATVLIKDQFDDSIRVPEDVENKLALSLLGVIPRTPDADPDIALADPKSPISEAYNSLRSTLLFSTPEGLPHIILVTSAQPAEGKTTSSYAIASSFARMGRTVLLIDADLRRPSLHRRINYDNSQGFSTLLTSQDPLDSALQPSTLPTLSLLTSGPIPPSPTELLTSLRIEDVLQQAARRFEVVVIDSPPILGLADSPQIAALADGVVFVVEADRSRRGALKTALRRLRAMRPVMLGVVLTKFDPLKAGNRYSEYYGYEYYQYSSKADR